MIVYCRSGTRAALAALTLKTLGLRARRQPRRRVHRLEGSRPADRRTPRGHLAAGQEIQHADNHWNRRTTEAINVDELGPVDYLVVEFPADKANFSGEMASELRTLIDSNSIRVLDLVMILKEEDGSIEASELGDADDSEVGELARWKRDLAILLAEEDVEEIGASLEPGSAAAVLVWENTWAAPFGSAIRRSGGQLVTSGRIPTQALIAAVEADRQDTAKGA